MAGEGLIPFNRERALEFISRQTEEIVDAQLEAADRIIVSQERITSGIDKVGVSVDRVSEGLEGLASAFEWGFSEIVWQLEQEREVLKDILKVLQAPLDTQAKEMRKRAEEAYRNGWTEDAIEDFLESEKKNRYDFTVHLSLGHIYFWQKKLLDKALEYYEKAAKYATSHSPYHASLAVFYLAEVKYKKGDFKKSYEAAMEAIKLYPKLYEAHYNCARYCACLGKYDEALEHLWEAVKSDRNYCLKAESEKDFDAMRPQLHYFYSNLLTKAQKQAKEETDKSQDLIKYAESYHLTGSEKFVKARQKQNEALELIGWASLFDYWDATYMAWDVEGLTLDALEGYLAGQISKASQEHTIAMTKFEDRKHWCLAAPLVVLASMHILCYIGYAIELFLKKNIGGGIAWLIFGTILLLIAFAINGVVLWGLTALIIWPIFYFLRKKEKARYESRLAQIHGKLSEVKNKRSEFILVKDTEKANKRDL
jgi:tetratricopeptide (TPR) repeat protein